MATGRTNNTQEKYMRILEAAAKVFSKKGFFNARVSDIAHEADVADGTIYIYFKNKDDILISLFEVIMQRFLSVLKDELAKLSSPEEKLKRLLQLHFKMSEENPEVAEVITIELRQSYKFIKEYKNLWFKEYLDIVSGIIKEGQGKKIFRTDIHPGIIKRAIFGALDELTLHWSLSKKYSLNECVEDINKLLISGLRAD